MRFNKNAKQVFTQHYVMDQKLYNAIHSLNRNTEAKRKLKNTVIPVLLGLLIAVPSFVVLILSK